MEGSDAPILARHSKDYFADLSPELFAEIISFLSPAECSALVGKVSRSWDAALFGANELVLRFNCAESCLAALIRRSARASPTRRSTISTLTICLRSSDTPGLAPMLAHLPDLPALRRLWLLSASVEHVKIVRGFAPLLERLVCRELVGASQGLTGEKRAAAAVLDDLEACASLFPPPVGRFGQSFGRDESCHLSPDADLPRLCALADSLSEASYHLPKIDDASLDMLRRTYHLSRHVGVGVSRSPSLPRDNGHLCVSLRGFGRPEDSSGIAVGVSFPKGPRGWDPDDVPPGEAPPGPGFGEPFAALFGALAERSAQIRVVSLDSVPPAAAAAAAALISALPRLEELHLTDCCLAGEAWASLLRAATSKPSLSSVHICRGHLAFSAFADWSLGAIREISIYNVETEWNEPNRVFDSIVRQLPQSSVESFEVSTSYLRFIHGLYTSEAVVKLGNALDACPKLRTLAVATPDGDGGGTLCSILASLPFCALEEIRLERLPIGAAAVLIKSFGRCKSLRRVVLGNGGMCGKEVDCSASLALLRATGPGAGVEVMDEQEFSEEQGTRERW